MKLLIVGADSHSSWQMRGRQLGAELGARVTTAPHPADWSWADIVVLVKRAALQYRSSMSQVRVPIVWDVLDYWPQPEGNTRTEADLVREVREIAQAAGITKLVGATQAMARAIGGVCVPHHCRIGLQPTAIRTKAEVVGYDGQAKYLGRWKTALERACEAQGLRFVINPPDLRSVDVIVSFRDGRWDGWVCREWKSGVKYVNAIVAGRPMLSQPSAAFRELQPVGQVLEAASSLPDALAHVTSQSVREAAYEDGRVRAYQYHVESIATGYAAILNDVRRRAA